MPRFRATSLVSLFVILPALLPAQEPCDEAGQNRFYTQRVVPLLKAKCWNCHGADAKPKGGLRLLHRDFLLEGGDSGPAISLDKPAESLLLDAINYGSFEMPPKEKLPADQIAILTRWVKLGAPTPGKPPAVSESAEDGEFEITEEQRNWWAYRPLRRPNVPQPAGESWVRNPIDAFILAGLESAGLRPNGPANAVALIRRATYDLIGLPPARDDIQHFQRAYAADPDKAVEDLVDRLLESEHYGEKWGRHWLDLVRYAESHGYERDSTKPFAWRYRDYVIQAFNQDKPYDRFLLEQLAGDELETVTSETLAATGFYRLGIWDDEPADRELALYDMLDDIVSTSSQAFLGMSIGCARCHDQKQVPKTDSYRSLPFSRDVTYRTRDNTRKFMDVAQQEAAAIAKREKEAREAALYHELFQLQEQFKSAYAKAQPTAAAVTTSDLVELQYRFYRDTWDSLPDFDTLRPETTGTLSDNLVTLEPASRPDSFGLVFEGRLRVPSDGSYTFHFHATEGTRLWLGNRVVDLRNQPGQHDVRVALAKGLTEFRLDYYNKTADPELKLAWSGPGFARALLSDAASSQVLVAAASDGGTAWSYTFKKPPADWMNVEFDAAEWNTGTSGFGRAGTPGSQVATPWHTDDIWLRQQFTLNTVPQAVGLNLHHDEDVEVYLNGQQVFQEKGYLVAYKQVTLGPEVQSLLRPGKNTIAVHCHQTGGGQYVDVSLIGLDTRPSIVSLILSEGRALLGAEKWKRYQDLQQQLADSRAEQPPQGEAIEVMCVQEAGNAPTHVLIRGNPHVKGEQVFPGFPRVLAEDETPVRPERTKHGTSGKRRALAMWLTSDENPTTPRVMANRLWQHHFGRGICPSPNDFGGLGELPTHPELLDWLAVELRDGGWTLKRMHKLIMTSNAYRMSSADSAAALAADPDNLKFWRHNMRRLTAEEIRDSILAICGNLNLKMAGPSIYTQIPREVMAGQSVPGRGWGSSPAEERARRSVYIFVKRSLIPPELSNFDFPLPDASCAARFTTTVPTQALNSLNSRFMSEQAAILARRLETEAGQEPEPQVALALELATSREPDENEIRWGLELISDLQQEEDVTAAKALEYFCLLVLNLNEFVYLD